MRRIVKVRIQYELPAGYQLLSTCVAIRSDLDPAEDPVAHLELAKTCEPSSQEPKNDHGSVNLIKHMRIVRIGRVKYRV